MNLAMALGYATSCVYDAEGYRSKAYLDTLARPPVWTIGHGTTLIDGKPVQAGMTCTETQAEDWAMAAMNEAASYVQNSVRVPLTDQQLGALTSFCYNVGCGHFGASTVKQALDHGLYAIAADRLLEYDHAGGRRLRGLTTRRARERAMFLRGTAIAAAPPAAPEVTADDLNQAELDRIG
jgi:lysozyme